MRLRNPMRDGEAQPYASKLVRPGFIGTVKAIKNVRQIVRGNANSGISKLCHCKAIIARERDSN
jgi:hypothetical protein